MGGGAYASQLGLNSDFDCCCCYCISLHILFAAVAIFECLDVILSFLFCFRNWHECA